MTSNVNNKYMFGVINFPLNSLSDLLLKDECCCRHSRTAATRDFPSIDESNFYSTNIPGEARLSGTTAESVFNSKRDETISEHQRAWWCLSRKAKSKRCGLTCFLKVAAEMAFIPPS